MSHSATLPRQLGAAIAAPTEQKKIPVGGNLKRGLAALSEIQGSRLTKAFNSGTVGRYKFDVILLSTDARLGRVDAFLKKHAEQLSQRGEGRLEVLDGGGLTVWLIVRKNVACAALTIIDSDALLPSRYSDLLKTITDRFRPCGRGLNPIVQQAIEEILSS